MRKLLAMSILSLISHFSLVSSGENNNEKEQVVRRIQEFTEAINKGNIDNLDSYWTEDGEIINPMTGDTVEGTKEISQYLQNKIKELKGKKIVFDVGDIAFPSADLAKVQGVLQIQENGKTVDRSARKIELIKDNGKWYLDTLKEIKVDLPPSAYEHLKELEWLVGKWKDEDDDTTIFFNTHWDKNKNFLTQKFSMEVYGLEALEGMEIIGWDPIEKQIRAWVYDSDGGFGSGIFVKTDKGYNIKMSYALSDGKKASATNVYTKIDNRSYSFSSIDRKIGDVALPNIEPVTVVKEE